MVVVVVVVGVIVVDVGAMGSAESICLAQCSKPANVAAAKEGGNPFLKLARLLFDTASFSADSRLASSRTKHAT